MELFNLYILSFMYNSILYLEIKEFNNSIFFSTYGSCYNVIGFCIKFLMNCEINIV